MGGSSTRLLLALLFVLVMAMAPSICARVGPPLTTYQKPVPLDQLVIGGFKSSLRRSRGQQPPPPTGNLPRFPSPPPLQPPPPPPPPETSCKEQLPWCQWALNSSKIRDKNVLWMCSMHLLHSPISACPGLVLCACLKTFNLNLRASISAWISCSSAIHLNFHTYAQGETLILMI